MIGPVFFSFRKQGDELWMMDPQYERVIENPEGTYAKIAAQRGNERLYKILPIKARNQGSSLIEIGEVLKDFPLFTLDIVSFDLLIGTRSREKDYIKEIKGYDNRLLIHASRAYRSSSMKIPGKPVASPYIGDWDTGICIKLLSKKTVGGSCCKYRSLFFYQQGVFSRESACYSEICCQTMAAGNKGGR